MAKVTLSRLRLESDAVSHRMASTSSSGFLCATKTLFTGPSDATATPSRMSYRSWNSTSVRLTSPAARSPERSRLAKRLGGRNSVSASMPQVSGTALRYGTEPMRLAAGSPITQALANASSPTHSRIGS